MNDILSTEISMAMSVRSNLATAGMVVELSKAHLLAERFANNQIKQLIAQGYNLREGMLGVSFQETSEFLYTTNVSDLLWLSKEFETLLVGKSQKSEAIRLLCHTWEPLFTVAIRTIKEGRRKKQNG